MSDFRNEIPADFGPCMTHGRINCLECYDIEPEDLDDDGHLIVVDGQSITDSIRRNRPETEESELERARR